MPLLWRKPIGKGQTVNEKECRCAERGTGMIKFRLYFDKDKETKWLNEMAAHKLLAFCGRICYNFTLSGRVCLTTRSVWMDSRVAKGDRL